MSATKTSATKLIWTGLGVSLLILALIVIDWPDQLVRVITCDVGQGDAILVTRGFQQALIDGGPDDTVLSCLGRYLPRTDKQLELVVATHLDADHIGGLMAVLTQYDVTMLLIPINAKDTELADQLWEQIGRMTDSGVMLKQPILGQQIGFPLVETAPWPPVERFLPARLRSAAAATFTVLSPRVEMLADCPSNSVLPETILSALSRLRPVCPRDSLSANDLSTVLLLQVGQIKVLLTGDIEGESEAALTKNPLIQDVNILKVSHHGSKNATSELWLTAVRPETALISSGKNNRYGHPAPEVLARLQQFDVDIRRTDLRGDIVIVTDGLKYWFELD